MLNKNLRMVILPFKGEHIFRSMRGWSQVKTKHSFSEQKMHSFIHFRKISGSGRLVTRFDCLFSQKHYRKEGIS